MTNIFQASFPPYCLVLVYPKPNQPKNPLIAHLCTAPPGDQYGWIISCLCHILNVLSQSAWKSICASIFGCVVKGWKYKPWCAHWHVGIDPSLEIIDLRSEVAWAKAIYEKKITIFLLRNQRNQISPSVKDDCSQLNKRVTIPKNKAKVRA